MTSTRRSHAILVVDDEPDIVGMVVAALELGKYDALSAGSSEEALRVAAERRPDAILLDRHLRDSAADDLVARLAANAATAHIPIVLMTGDSESSEVLLGLGSSLVGLIRKPFDPESLLSTLRALFPGTSPRGASASSGVRQRITGDLASGLDSANEDEPAPMEEAPGASRFRQLAELLHEARFCPNDPFYLAQAQKLARLMRARPGACCAAAAHIDDLLATALVSGAGPATYAATDEAVADGFKQLGLLAQSEFSVQGSRSASSVDLLIVASDPVTSAALDIASGQLLLETRHATSFREALHAARRFRPSAIAVEMMAPKAKMMELVRAIRAEPRELTQFPARSPMPILLLGTTTDVDARLAIAGLESTLYFGGSSNIAGLGRALARLIALRERAGSVLLVGPVSELVEGTLRGHGLSVTQVAEPRAAFEVLAGARTDVVLVDERVHGVSPVELCGALARSADSHARAIVLLARRPDEETRRAALRAGADEVLAARESAEGVALCVRRLLERAAVARQEGWLDVETGAVALPAFRDALQALLTGSQRSQAPLSLCVWEIDDAERLRSRRGAGVLAEIVRKGACLLQNRLGPDALTAILPHRRFAAVLIGCDRDAAEQVASACASAFARLRFPGTSSLRFSTTLSTAIASAPADGFDASAMLLKAAMRLRASDHLAHAHASTAQRVR